MPKAAWCTATPMTGKGNGTILISATANEDRAARSTIVTVQTTGGGKPSKTISVTQAGKGVLTMDATHPDVPGAGGVVAINGTSNSPSLVLTSMLLALEGITGNLQVNNELPILIENTNGIETITIPGDPGVNGIYDFVITLNVPQNPLTTKAPFPIQVSGGGANATCMLYLLPGA